jgi:hypothetical protein
MNSHTRIFDGADPFGHPLDALLADIAISILLPPGLHGMTGERYASVRKYIERAGSPLEGKVEHFYPQGSMAIDATISTRGTDDEYDLDVVAQLAISPDAEPHRPLDLLEAALVGYPVERRVDRQTRCVTIYYADGMHMDVTPSSRLPSQNERESHIFHAKREQAKAAHFHVPMNAFGFAKWYCARTPTEQRFAFELARRYYESAGLEFRAAADVDHIPDQTPLIAKNTATVALQLLKRFRNVQYARNAGRIPPSVVLSRYAALAATPDMPLSLMLIRLCRLMIRDIDAASQSRKLLHVANPVFDRDVFTDRWPESFAQQAEWRGQLIDLADTIQSLRQNESSLEDLRDMLPGLFGDNVVAKGMRRFNDRSGRAVQTGQVRHTGQGGVFVPSRPAIVASPAIIAAPAMAAGRPHTFMGGVLK